MGGDNAAKSGPLAVGAIPTDELIGGLVAGVGGGSAGDGWGQIISLLLAQLHLGKQQANCLLYTSPSPRDS